jgi:predicted ATPase
MRPCHCSQIHTRRRVVLTGGPGAGKTAVLELVRQAFCQHVRVLAEAASILFAGGFPRDRTPETRRPAQRAIFHVQRELEALGDATNTGIVLCDRGTVDGAAYWPGPGDLFTAVGTTRADELRRYDAVIHLRVPDASRGYNQANPLRIETAAEAALIDERLLEAWSDHPRRFIVPARNGFLDKATDALAVLRGELPACCR